MSGGQPERPYGRSHHLKKHNLKTLGQHLAEHPASDEHRKEGQQHVPPCERDTVRETQLCIDNLLVRIHLITELILVDRPCAMGV